ncbi:MAG: single-stranded DNA-binding protein, partial [Eubacteriales bacterium]|nr:single-stranded DNA-binding protein [Eubacteriales bacterium]
IDKKNHLILTIFAKDINLNLEIDKNPNQVMLNGFLCKPPIYRKTPFGREIADILLAVNRSYNKSDYIPCITWGRNAKFANNLEVGQNIIITGRMQSRNYQKKLENGEIIEKVAYEVSVSKLEVSKDNKDNNETNFENNNEYEL